jgi:hypothetical protein
MEPGKHTRDILAINTCTFSSIRIHPFAVGVEDGEAKFIDHTLSRRGALRSTMEVFDQTECQNTEKYTVKVRSMRTSLEPGHGVVIMDIEGLQLS